MTATISRPADALVTLSLSDPATGKADALTCTPEHPLYVVGGGWAEAGSLGVGTQIVTRAGPPVTVTKVDWQRAGKGEKPFTVYNLTVEGDHTYFAGTLQGGVWAHNSCIDDLDLSREWRFHYSNEPNLDTSGLRPGEGTDKVFMTDLLPDNASADATSMLTGAGPLKYGYPVDVTGLNIEEAGKGFANGASDEFYRGLVPPSRVLPPYKLW